MIGEPLGRQQCAEMRAMAEAVARGSKQFPDAEFNARNLARLLLLAIDDIGAADVALRRLAKRLFVKEVLVKLKADVREDLRHALVVVDAVRGLSSDSTSDAFEAVKGEVEKFDAAVSDGSGAVESLCTCTVACEPRGLSDDQFCREAASCRVVSMGVSRGFWTQDGNGNDFCVAVAHTDEEALAVWDSLRRARAYVEERTYDESRYKGRFVRSWSEADGCLYPADLEERGIVS